jgi:FkbM family methyltransferase
VAILSSIFIRSLRDSHGARAKLAVAYSIASWTAGKLRLPVPKREVRLKIAGLEMTIDTSCSEVWPFWEIWYRGAYEFLPQFRAATDSIVVDAGANVGFYCMRQASRCPQGMVYSFEPSPAVFARLQHNVESNVFRNIRIFQIALGKARGAVGLDVDSSSILTKVSQNGSVSVECDMLDNKVAEAGIRHIDILKVDVEGYEPEVLAGAEIALSITDRVVVEFHYTSKELDTITSMLAPHGFARAAVIRNEAYFEKKPM